MSKRDDWFRSDAWDDEARESFEAALARRRSPPGQFVRIKGLTLTLAGDRRRVEAGMQLLRRVIADYPDELPEVAGAHFALGEALARRGDLSEAVEHFRACQLIERGIRYSHGVELALAETLTALAEKTGRRGTARWARSPATSGGDVDAEALLLLDEADASAAFNSQRWRIGVTRSRLLNRRGDLAAAATEASRTLALLECGPQLPRHPTVGLIEADDATVAELRSIAARTRSRTRRS